MALAALQNTNNATNTVNLLSGLADIFLGKSSTTSGGTTTQQTVLSQEAVTALINQMLSSNSGLAAVSSGQKTSGLYNSSTHSLLLNDLLSRVAGEVATKGAATVTSRTPQTTKQEAQLNPITSALGIGAGWLGNKVLDKIGLKKKAGSLFDDIWDSAFPSASAGESLISASSAGTAGVSQVFPVANSAENIIATDLMAGAASSPEAVANLADLGGAASDLASADTMYFDDWGVGSDLDAGSTLTDVASEGVPILGPAVNLLEGDVEGAAGNMAGYAIGNALLPGVGGAIGSVLGGVVSDGCFITTAAVDTMGLADDCYELTTLRNFRDNWMRINAPEDIVRYYREAPIIVSKLKTRLDATVIFKSFYRDYICLAVELIDAGLNKEAYECYKRLFTLAKDLAEEINHG